MDTKTLIELLGGPSVVMTDTGLSKGRISQWVTSDKIPRPWLRFYVLKRPDIPWADYTGQEPVPLDLLPPKDSQPSPESQAEEDPRAAERRVEEDRRQDDRRKKDRRTAEQGGM